MGDGYARKRVTVKLESFGRKDGKEPTGEMRERVERGACGKMAGRDAGWENIIGIWG